jgi:diguanylate cyclase (GGDEF)-like protein
LVYDGLFSPEKLSWILTAVNLIVFFALLLDSRFRTLPFVRNIYSGEDYFVFHFFNCIVTFFVVILFSSMFVKGIMAKNNELNKEAVVDKVTGLFNRLGLIRFVENSGFKDIDDFTVAIMDIDNFKSINDTYGHAAGDAALRFVGAKLQNMINDHMLACRWGGDEFLFVELSENHSETLYNTLQELREEIAHSTIVVGETMFSIRVSAGLASFEEGDTMEKVFYKADKALYESKAAGKDRVTKEG